VSFLYFYKGAALRPYLQYYYTPKTAVCQAVSKIILIANVQLSMIVDTYPQKI
jgi:hypothetical protein